MGFSAGKRKSRDEEDTLLSLASDSFPIDDLSDDVLERVLSWLPTSCFFRMSSVCKRWKSTQSSKSFNLACSQIPRRDPWFFMIGDDSSDSSFVFDSTENNWKNLNRRHNLHRRDFIPVASSGGLLCFRCSISGDFLLRNPLTGSSRDLPSPISRDDNNNNKPLQAVAMATVTPSSYKLVTISGETPNLSFRFYESNSGSWSKESDLVKNNTDEEYNDSSHDDDETGTVYFLSKTGNVVVASNNLQRSPSKLYSSVITIKDNVEIVYFLSSYGTIISCNLTKRCFTELPKLLPPCLEYSIDLVECSGTMFVILLSEFYESASLRIWKLEKQEWVHVGMLPPAMSHELYGRKGDINCVGGAGNKILVCFNASPPEVYYRYFVYDLVSQEWTDLPSCFKDGEAVDFVSALSFQPRIEATV
ncbi:hypothetical protein EUTSA_v10025320mg [Eutrema salsugineum]|uniref:F-box domain-containing protein n=1 Tax=Eutrema salsugineum TaxID=72664 RepID=V4MM05_EUTSA|nr:F-box only protein 13 [Eutrema salsugineum]ESQ53838.1 hypothetical protein EUTSA_v10025320mg [Eutrema salsugineum]